MLSGDFATMGLPDVLQWMDATRVSGVLTIERSAESLSLTVKSRTVVHASLPPNRPVPLPAFGGDPLPVDLDALAGELALEHLYDQFLDPEGRFRFEANGKPGPGLEVDVALVELLMESLPLLDEWPGIEARFPNEGGHLSLAGGAIAEPTRVQAAIVECAKRGLSIADTRFTLGLSRPALLRRVNELVAIGVVAVPGVSTEEDLTVKLVAQARALLRERQFDEAAHVFSALLATDPGAASVRHLLEGAETAQIDWLRSEVPADAIPVRMQLDADLGVLTHADREVLGRINERWDVSVLVLLSPMKETETLKSLRKLVRMRLVELRPAESTPSRR